MKLNSRAEIAQYAKTGMPVYQAGQNGITVGHLVFRMRPSFEGGMQYFLVMSGSNTAYEITTDKDAELNLPYGYFFSLESEAVEHVRREVVAYIERMNQSVLAPCPVKVV